MKPSIPIITLVLALTPLAITALGDDHYTRFFDDRFPTTTDTEPFSVDVIAVDARTGEVIASSGVLHRDEFPDNFADQQAFPRLSRVPDSGADSIKVSGVAQDTVHLTMCARDYENTDFEIDPSRVGSTEGPLVIKMALKNEGSKTELTSTATL